MQEPGQPKRLDLGKVVEPGPQHTSVDPAPTFFPLFLEPGLLGSSQFPGPSLTLATGKPSMAFLEVIS